MKKVSEYMHVSGTGDELSVLVEKYIAEGWQPFGGIAIAHVDVSFSTPDGEEERELHFEYAQAMVKYE